MSLHILRIRETGQLPTFDTEMCYMINEDDIRYEFQPTIEEVNR